MFRWLTLLEMRHGSEISIRRSSKPCGTNFQKSRRRDDSTNFLESRLKFERLRSLIDSSKNGILANRIAFKFFPSFCTALYSFAIRQHEEFGTNNLKIN